MAPILEAANVFRLRPADGRQVAILRDVSLSLENGEFAAVMGPSGSGKSTLLHVLAGLDAPSAGSVSIAGQEITALDEEARTAVRRRSIGFIFQFFHLLPDLTVEENVALPLMILGRNPKRHRERLERLFAMLGLEDLRKRRPMALSGGEMQRVSIARALAAEQPLLLADEPTGNLSSKAGEEVVALLGQARRELGVSVLLVTHNPRDAAAADRVLFLHDGSLREGAELHGGPFGVADVFSRLQELGI
ncbi:MAG: ABC transporter ATP-binding protein [Planctomycetota bacterium]